jgi:hypothetical protein
MKLTADVVASAPAYLNALGDREKGFRGLKATLIENLGVIEDQYDTLDFSDNSISRCAGFPLMPRLKTLLLADNRVKSIGAVRCVSTLSFCLLLSLRSPSNVLCSTRLLAHTHTHAYTRFLQQLGRHLPHLAALVLTNNNIRGVGDLKALRACANLKWLSLTGNPVSKATNYRLAVIHTLPQLVTLDACRVTEAERVDAVLLLGPIVKYVAGKGASNENDNDDNNGGAIGDDEAGDGGDNAAMDVEGAGEELDPAQRAKIIKLIQVRSTFNMLASVCHHSHFIISLVVP